MNKQTIIDLLNEEEMIEYTILPLENQKFLVNLETSNKKEIKFITDNWTEFYNDII